MISNLFDIVPNEVRAQNMRPDFYFEIGSYFSKKSFSNSIDIRMIFE